MLRRPYHCLLLPMSQTHTHTLRFLQSQLKLKLFSALHNQRFYRAVEQKCDSSGNALILMFSCVTFGVNVWQCVCVCVHDKEAKEAGPEALLLFSLCSAVFPEEGRQRARTAEMVEIQIRWTQRERRICTRLRVKMRANIYLSKIKKESEIR